MNTEFSNFEDVVSIADLQKMLHVGRNTAYAMVRDGRIRTVKNGKRYIIPKKSVIDFLNSNS